MVAGYGKALRGLWTGRCDLFVQETVVNLANGRDVTEEVQRLSGEPCRLSFSSVSSVKENSNAALTHQVVRLFIGPDVKIPPGSKLVITQGSYKGTYKKSGAPAVYSTHQEVVLELEEEWS